MKHHKMHHGGHHSQEFPAAIPGGMPVEHAFQGMESLTAHDGLTKQHLKGAHMHFKHPRIP